MVSCSAVIWEGAVYEFDCCYFLTAAALLVCVLLVVVVVVVVDVHCGTSTLGVQFRPKHWFHQSYRG